MLKHRRKPLPDTDAECSDPVVHLAAIHLMNQRRGEPSAAGTQRMADRDRATLDIDAVHVEAEFTYARDGLCCEGLIQFKQADVIDRESGSIERFPGGRDWSKAHRRGVDTGRCRWTDQGENLTPLAAGQFGFHQHQRRGTVVDAAGVAGGHGGLLVLGEGRS